MLQLLKTNTEENSSCDRFNYLHLKITINIKFHLRNHFIVEYWSFVEYVDDVTERFVSHFKFHSSLVPFFTLLTINYSHIVTAEQTETRKYPKYVDLSTKHLYIYANENDVKS